MTDKSRKRSSVLQSGSKVNDKMNDSVQVTSKKRKASRNIGLGSFHFRGLRSINLAKNNFGEDFLSSLSKCLKHDCYIKSLDLSYNNFRERELMEFVRSKIITENQTL